HPGIVVAPASAPQWLADLVAERGSELRATRADPASVIRAAAQPGVTIGADLDGGFVWPHQLLAFDAMRSQALLRELRTQTDATLSVARGRLPTFTHLTAEEPCPWEDKGRIMRVLTEQHRGPDVDLVDGIKVREDGGFVLMRPDPDLPTIHIVVSVREE